MNKKDEYDAFETSKLWKGMANALIIELYVVALIAVVVAFF